MSHARVRIRAGIKHASAAADRAAAVWWSELISHARAVASFAWLLPQETAENNNAGSDLDETGSQVCERVGIRLETKQLARVSR